MVYFAQVMRSARSASRFVLLAALMAALVSATVDPTAPNRDPSHGHIILGGSALDRARALAWHMRYGHEEDLIAHVPGLPHQEDENAEGAGARVLIIRGVGGVTVLGSAGSAILVLSWSLVPPLPAPERAAPPSSLPAIESTMLVPEPPPRAS